MHDQCGPWFKNDIIVFDKSIEVGSKGKHELLDNGEKNGVDKEPLRSSVGLASLLRS